MSARSRDWMRVLIQVNAIRSWLLSPTYQVSLTPEVAGPVAEVTRLLDRVTCHGLLKG